MLFLSVRGVLRLRRADKSLAIDVVVVLPSSLLERSRHPVPNGLFEAQSPGPPIPLSTLQARPRDLACKTRGQDGFAAPFSCRALSSPSRFIPAHSEYPSPGNNPERHPCVAGALKHLHQAFFSPHRDSQKCVNKHAYRVCGGSGLTYVECTRECCV